MSGWRELVVPSHAPQGQRRRLLEPVLEYYVEKLQRAHGRAWFRWRTLRKMLFADTGYVCGARSLQRAARRMVRKQQLAIKRVGVNRSYVRGKAKSVNGCVALWTPTEHDRREMRWADALRKRRARAEARRRAREEAARERAEHVERSKRLEEERARDAADARRARRKASVDLGRELVRPGRDASPAPAAPLEQLAFTGLPELLAKLAASPSSSSSSAPRTPLTREELEERRRRGVEELARMARDEARKPPDKPPDQ